MSPAAEFDAMLRVARARMHCGVASASALASAGLGAVLASLLWGHVPATPLLAWLLALVAVLSARAALALAQARDADAPAHAAAWLRRHRVVLFAQGLVWALAVLLVLAPGVGPEPLRLLVVVFAALVAGASMAAAFDLKAVALFAGPPVAALAAALVVAGLVPGPWPGPGREPAGLGPLPLPLLLLLVLVLLLTALSAWRAQRSLHQGIERQMAQAAHDQETRQAFERADRAHRQLADQMHLLTQLLQTTHQGFWFVDNDGTTTQINPAMALMLGRPQAQVVGRSVFDFFAGAELEHVRLGLTQRHQGHPGSAELGLVRPDGSRLHCLVHATPLYDAQGGRIGSVAVYTDITARREAEDMLRTYELAVNSITDVVSVTDEHEVYRLVNDAWCRVAGVAREAALGAHPTEVFRDALLASRHAALQRALETGLPQTARGPLRRSGGVEQPLMETTYYPAPGRGPDGRFVAMITRDITESQHTLQRVQALQAEQQALLEAFPGFIARIDAAGNYTFANRRLAALHGSRSEDLLHVPAAELLGPERGTQLRAMVARVLAGEQVVYEACCPARGEMPEVHAEFTLARGTDPRTGAPVVYGFGIDVGARKQAERALIAARDEAQCANSAKSRFLAQMSHELRTPLNAILGFGQLLQGDTEHPLQAGQRAQVREMLAGARHLLVLINEVLDLGRIEAGVLAVEQHAVALVPLMEECQALVQALARQHGVGLLPPLHDAACAAALADGVRLKQVLLNLLANGIKYNRTGGVVQLRSSSDGATHVRLEVRDTGPGLDEAQTQRLFQPFERLDAPARGIEGAGIGLALSQRLVEAMGGSIGVDSRRGEGSRFWLRLPGVALPMALSAPQVNPPPRALPAAEVPTVLYIEDNPVNVVLMEAMLARAPQPLRVLCAAHPHEGLELARRQRPQLILLDLQLPDMSGMALLQVLRGDARTSTIPVVAVSANAVSADIDAALAAGMAAYLTKPLDLAVLLDTVQRCLAPPPQAGAGPSHFRSRTPST